MYDFAVPNAKPGRCEKCKGSGFYRWGAVVNGKCTNEGPCWSCKGTGKQSRRQIKTNQAYNRHKMVEVFRADNARAARRWSDDN